jgi:hypothetical protein
MHKDNAEHDAILADKNGNRNMDDGNASGGDGNELAYKAVTADLRSCCLVWGGLHAIQYKIGEFVRPSLEGSKLWIFKDKSAALNFKTPQGRVFLCEAKNIISPDIELGCPPAYDPEKFAAFWKDVHNYRKVRYKVPVGTRWADEVKLIKEIFE